MEYPRSSNNGCVPLIRRTYNSIKRVTRCSPSKRKFNAIIVQTNDENGFFERMRKKQSLPSVDGGKHPSQQRGSLPIPQVPIRLMNVWYGRLDGIMDPLLSKVWFLVGCFKAQECKLSQLSKLIYLTKLL